MVSAVSSVANSLSAKWGPSRQTGLVWVNTRAGSGIQQSALDATGSLGTANHRNQTKRIRLPGATAKGQPWCARMLTTFVMTRAWGAIASTVETWSNKLKTQMEAQPKQRTQRGARCGYLPERGRRLTCSTPVKECCGMDGLCRQSMGAKTSSFAASLAPIGLAPFCWFRCSIFWNCCHCE